MKITFRKEHEEAQLPTYGSAMAAGADVRSTHDIIIPPGEVRLVDTGLGCNIPEGYEIQVRPRSGLALKHGITVLNSPGTIDADYTGKIGIILMNLGKQIFTVNKGDRVAQIVAAPVIMPVYEFSDETKDTERGSAGFGSTDVS